MSSQTAVIVVWSVALLAVIALLWWLTRPKGPDEERQPRSGPGPGAMGAVYDLLHEDKRRAIEIIAEGRAEATDPEHADGTPKTGL